LQVVLRHPRGGQPADHPASTFTSASRPAGGRCHGEADLRPCGFIALCASCARPTPRDELHDSHRPGAGDCATVSLSRGVPLPDSPNPFTTGPDLLVHLLGPATLMGFLVPFAVFPGGGSPHFCGSSPLAVSRFAVAHAPADFYGRPVAHLISFPVWGGILDATGSCDARRRPASGSCCRRQAERARLPSRIVTMPRSTGVCRARQSCRGLV
jgi:hypothetical protein